MRRSLSLPWSIAAIALCAASSVRAETAEGFKLPSGNIICNYTEGTSDYPATLRCDILQKTSKSPPAPRDCELDYGSAFEVTKTGRGKIACVGDTVAGYEYAVLPYGQTWQKDGFSCHSATSGVLCRNARGGGFELSRARQRVF